MWVQLSVQILLNTILPSIAGPLAWAACQTACNAGAVACYSAAGLTFGITAPVTWWAWFAGAPAAAAACSAIQGTCMAACTPLLLAPTP